MNRAERRAQAKQERSERAIDKMAIKCPDDLTGAYFKKRAEVYDRISRNGITPNDLQDSYKRGYDAGVEEANKRVGVIYAAAMCEALNDLHGFGRKRLMDIAGRMCEIMVETFTTQDAIDRVFKKTGIRFTSDDPFNFFDFDD